MRDALRCYCGRSRLAALSHLAVIAIAPLALCCHCHLGGGAPAPHLAGVQPGTTARRHPPLTFSGQGGGADGVSRRNQPAPGRRRPRRRSP